MTRAINLDLAEAPLRDICADLGVAISAIEKLDGGGVRLVCASASGAAAIRKKLDDKIIAGKVTRSRILAGAMQPTSWTRDPETAAANRIAARERRGQP
jgi:hypothetical protein